MERMEALRKKAIFQAARRAILENEMFLRDYVTNHLPESYTEEDLENFIAMLVRMFDNDLFDLVMGVKSAEDLQHLYDYRFIKDIQDFAEQRRTEIKKAKGLI
ncbi:succinate dehydrogenase assembly factor 2 [Seleniivibrio woodruffii]|uniref:FAD assembly factor SdhE n=1 Tax=Seleniivibrio woodruffii TaxID=1078050 RepID=UPI0026EE9DBE|nr:succinate dehydrogenase assembly factor 2 [Seleniivibrio woodruffii]